MADLIRKHPITRNLEIFRIFLVRSVWNYNGIFSDFNISSPLANYMVYGINTALREHLSIMLQNENYRKLLANMDIELQQKLQETQMKFPDLVRAIGIR